jgi:hypothetical protein
MSSWLHSCVALTNSYISRGRGESTDSAAPMELDENDKHSHKQKRARSTSQGRAHDVRRCQLMTFICMHNVSSPYVFFEIYFVALTTCRDRQFACSQSRARSESLGPAQERRVQRSEKIASVRIKRCAKYPTIVAHILTVHRCRDARKGEADRRQFPKLAKHLLAGKMSNGTRRSR